MQDLFSLGKGTSYPISTIPGMEVQFTVGQLLASLEFYMTVNHYECNAFRHVGEFYGFLRLGQSLPTKQLSMWAGERRGVKK